jgi:hypothetical protein
MMMSTDKVCADPTQRQKKINVESIIDILNSQTSPALAKKIVLLV